MLKKLISFAVICSVLLTLSGCGGSSNENTFSTEPARVQVTMESGDTFVIETAPQYAPETCANFLTLVSDGFYDGLTFHRVINDFVAQGGDPTGDGTGGSGKSIKGEFADNGFTQNTLSHTKGVVSMARRGSDMDSATSQFFICYDTITSLDGKYAAFGNVIEGMETVEKFLEIPRDDNGKPDTPIVIKEMKIITE